MPFRVRLSLVHRPLAFLAHSVTVTSQPIMFHFGQKAGEFKMFVRSVEIVSRRLSSKHQFLVAFRRAQAVKNALFRTMEMCRELVFPNSIIEIQRSRYVADRQTFVIEDIVQLAATGWKSAS